MVSSKQILADVGKFVGRGHNKRSLEDRVAIVSFFLWHMVNQFFLLIKGASKCLWDFFVNYG